MNASFPYEFLLQTAALEAGLPIQTVQPPLWPRALVSPTGLLCHPVLEESWPRCSLKNRQSVPRNDQLVQKWFALQANHHEWSDAALSQSCRAGSKTNSPIEPMTRMDSDTAVPKEQKNWAMRSPENFNVTAWLASISAKRGSLAGREDIA
jgi:hypothetical protein